MSIFIHYDIGGIGTLRHLSVAMGVKYDPGPGPYIQFYRDGQPVGFVARTGKNGLVVMVQLEEYFGQRVIDTRNMTNEQFLALGKNPGFNFQNLESRETHQTISPFRDIYIVDRNGIFRKVCRKGFIIQLKKDPPEYEYASDFLQRYELCMVPA